MIDLEIGSVDGLALRYEVHGERGRPCVVLLHGLGADRRMWAPQVGSLPTAGYQVIVPDLRGHGRSGSPAVFRLSDCAGDVRDLLDALQVTRAHLVGVSMGGAVAQQISVDFPERVASQTLVDSFSGLSRSVERFNAALAAAALRLVSPRTQAALVRRTYVRLGHPGVGDYLAERLLAADRRHLLQARLAVNRFDVLDRLPSMRAPTLVVVGDAFGRLAVDMARTTANRIPGATLTILPGGGDPSNLLVPDAFDAVLLDFLGRRQET